MISGKSVIATEWVFLIVACSLAAARIFVRVRSRKDHVWMSDAFVIAAVLFALGLVICDTLTYQDGMMDDFRVTSIANHKTRFATSYLFNCGLYFPKFSMIAFYYQLVPATTANMRFVLFALTSFAVAGFFTTTFANTFWCGLDPSTNWSEDIEACRAVTSVDLVRLNWSFNITSEVLIFLFPLPIIRNLEFPRRREKIGLWVLFTMGIATLVVSTGRFATMLVGGNEKSVFIWATSEICISIMVVSLTALRPLLRKISHLVVSSVDGSDPRKNAFKATSQRHQRLGGEEPWAEWKDSDRFQIQCLGSNNNDSDIRLAVMESGKIYKTETFTITDSMKGSAQLSNSEPCR